VQIPKLKPNDQSRVENVLSIFSQNIKNNDEHKLNYDETQATDPLTKRIVNRLLRAIADDNLQRIMNVEDEIEQNLIEIEEKVKKKFDIALLKSKKTIEKNKKTIKAKDQEIEAKDQEIEALKKLLANKNNQ
jgi:protein tyrosine/serine phosphatase